MRAKTVQDTINEAVDYQYDDENLNAAELRSLAQGKNVLTKAQMAACYLNAKNAAGRSEDNKTNFAARMARKMNKAEKETDFQRVTAPRLADMLDLSWRTVSYTVSKFRLLLDGNREGTISNVMYEKILYYFDLFEKMQPSQVMAIAMEAVDPNADYTQSEEAAESSAKYSKISQEKKKASEKLKVDMINSLTSAFSQYKPLGEEKAAKRALAAMVTKYGITLPELIQTIKASKIESSLRRIFLSAS